MSFFNSVRLAPGLRSAVAVACGLVLSCGQVAWAVEDVLEPVVVTATRSPTRVSRLVADVTVIGRHQIEQSSGQSVSGLLSNVPGVQVSSQGGTGQSSSVFIRGGDSGQVLLLIDGVPYNSATLGSPSLDNLPLEEIDRIEIVRGPLASLYGSAAASGVIQIFTRKGQAGFVPSASVTVGSDRYYNIAAGFSGGGDRVTFSLHGSGSAESGFSATNSKVGSNFNPDRDGFVQHALTASLGVKLNDAWSLGGNFLLSQGVIHFDDGVAESGVTPDTSSGKSTSVTGLSLAGRVGPDWRTTLRVAKTDDSTETKLANKSWNLGHFVTSQELLGWENQIATPLGLALVALEQVSQDVGMSPETYTVSSRTIQSLVLGLQGSGGRHDWQLSARQDNNSQFGQESTAAIGYGVRFAEDWKVSATFGNNFIAPSFNDLYWPGTGNAGLKPQHGVNKDLSLVWAREGRDLRLTRYESRIRDLIQWEPIPDDPDDRWQPVNVTTSLSGWTLSGSASERFLGGRLFASGSLDWLDAHRVDTGAKSIRRADRSASLRAGFEVGAMAYELSAKAISGAPDSGGKHLAGYTLWGASVRWSVSKDWSLGLRADNIGNHSYATASGYNQPLNRYFMTLSYTPKTK